MQGLDTIERGVTDERPLDILHSYLGLAALSLMKEPGLKTVDPVMCISLSAGEHLDRVSFADKADSVEIAKMSEHEAEQQLVVADGLENKHKYMSISGG